MRFRLLSLFVLTLPALLSGAETPDPLSAFWNDLFRERPELRKKLDKMETEKLEELLLKHLLPGASRQAPPPETKGNGNKPLSPVRNGCVLRIAPEALTEDLSRVLRQEKPFPEALLLDLRHCSGGSPEGVRKMTALLREKSALPVAALIAGGTRGEAEQLVFLLKQRGRFITLGEPTAGQPHPVRKIVIAGTDWYLPDPGPEWSKIPFQMILPDIRVPASGKEDLCLRRGVELLTALSRMTPNSEHALKKGKEK